MDHFWNADEVVLRMCSKQVRFELRSNPYLRRYAPKMGHPMCGIVTDVGHPSLIQENLGICISRTIENRLSLGLLL
jgi:hypothetical protein